jgi:hypothetical protein
MVSEDAWARCKSPPRCSYCGAAPDIAGSDTRTCLGRGSSNALLMAREACWEPGCFCRDSCVRCSAVRCGFLLFAPSAVVSRRQYGGGVYFGGAKAK